MFWILMFGSAALVSILVVNPIPLAILFVAWLVMRPAEVALEGTIRAAGGNPALPASPTSATGCAAFVLFFVVMGLALLTFIGLAVIVMGGGG